MDDFNEEAYSDRFVAFIARSLNASEIPCILWGDCLMTLYGIDKDINVSFSHKKQTPDSKLTPALVTSLHRPGHVPAVGVESSPRPLLPPQTMPLRRRTRTGHLLSLRTETHSTTCIPRAPSLVTCQSGPR